MCLGSSRTRFSLPTAWGAAGARTLGWDPAGQLTSCWDGSGSASFKYDPFGRRIEATGNGQTTYDLYGASDGGRPIAEYAGGGWYREAIMDGVRWGWLYQNGDGRFTLPDALGSTAVFAQDGTVQASRLYPFGEEAQATPAEYKWTNQIRDANALDHFAFRTFSSNLVRWLSPDPAGLAAVDPASWNRYTYVENMPLEFTDPLGLDGNGCDVSGSNPDGPVNCNYNPGGYDASWAPPAPTGLWPLSGDALAAYSAYVSWVGAMFQTGGSAVGSNGYQYSVTWNIESGASWLNPYGNPVYDPAEVGLPSLLGPTGSPGASAGAPGGGAFGGGGGGGGGGGSTSTRPTAACLGAGLTGLFGGNVSIGPATAEVGGHWNFAVTLTFGYAGAAAFHDAYANAMGGWYPPARFLAHPSIHLENVFLVSQGGGLYTYTGTAHFDLFNPNSGPGGLFGHIFDDGFWGDFVQLFGGNIDPGSCPF